MAGPILKGETFAADASVTNEKLHDLVEDALFKGTDGNGVSFTASTGGDLGTCVAAGGLEVHSDGQLQIKDDGVTTARIADNAITTALIANSTGTSDGIITAKIADNAITTAKILNNNVTLAKMATQADQTVLGNVSGGTAVPTAVPIVGAAGILINSDSLGTDDTKGATQGNIKAYVDLLRPKYIALTGGTTGLTQSSEATYQYNIADFTGSGLTAANIYQIHILCNLQTNFDAGGTNSRVQASYPNAIDTLVTIFQTTREVGGDSTQDFSSLVTVPINASQSYVKVGLEFVNSGSFQIVGATVFK